MIVEWNVQPNSENNVYGVETLLALIDKENIEGSVLENAVKAMFGTTMKFGRSGPEFFARTQYSRIPHAPLQLGDTSAATLKLAFDEIFERHALIERTLAEVMKIRGSNERTSIRFGKALAKAFAGIKINVTIAAEIAVAILRYVNSNEYSSSFDLVAKQECVDYAMRILKEIKNVRTYDADMHANAIDKIKEIDPQVKIDNDVGLSMYFKRSGATQYRTRTLNLLADKLFNRRGKCERCSFSLEEPSMSTGYDGKMLAIPDTTLTYGRVFASLIAYNLPSPFIHLNMRIPGDLKCALADAMNGAGELKIDPATGYMVREDYERIRDIVGPNYAFWMNKAVPRAAETISTIEDRIIHALDCHRVDGFIIPEIPSLHEIMSPQAMRVAISAQYIDLPLVGYTVLIPSDYTPYRDELSVQYLQRISMYRSLDLSEFRILEALDGLRHNGMEAFKANPDILARNEAFDRITTARLVKPHKFQREYLNRTLRAVVAMRDSGVDYATAMRESGADEMEYVDETEDNSLVIDLGVLVRELGLGSISEEIGLSPEALAYVRIFLQDAQARHGGIDVAQILLKYLRANSETYAQATYDCVANKEKMLQISALILYRLRGSSRFIAAAENMMQEEESKLQQFMQMNSTVILRAPAVSGPQISDNSGSPMSPMATPTLGIDHYARVDFMAMTILVSMYGERNGVEIVQNVRDVNLERMGNVTGSGKTTNAILAAALFNKIKSTFPQDCVNMPNLELATVCDHVLVRGEIFRKILLELRGRINASLIEIGSGGRVRIVSNFTEDVTIRKNGKDVRIQREPRFKSSKRDMFIMSSSYLIPYVLGKKTGVVAGGSGSGTWYGNPDAFVFIDEFGAKIGGAAAIDDLTTATDITTLAKVFNAYVPAILLMYSVPRMLTLVGATIVPLEMIRRAIKRFQPARTINVGPSTGNGNIYVGSQFVTPMGATVDLWEICSPDLLCDLFTGFSKPLLKRMVGHRAAVKLQARVREAIERRHFPWLAEMSEYVEYDIGTYTGDSIADYALGLLYFISLYATSYLGPAPDLCLTCGDMQAEVPITLPQDAPWPRSHFARPGEYYRALARPAPHSFLRYFGISRTWEIKPTIEELNAVGPYPAHTIMGHCIDYLRKCIAGTDMRAEFGSSVMVLDPNPHELALAMLSFIKGTSDIELQRIAKSTVENAVSVYYERKRALEREIEMATRARPRDGNKIFNEKTQQFVRVAAAPTDGRDGGNQQQNVILTTVNAETQNPNYEPTLNCIETIDQYLLSYGIICIATAFSEAHNRAVYDYLSDPSRASKIFMIITDQDGAYGVNIHGVTYTVSTPRASMYFSVETIKQQQSRGGRGGLSNDSRNCCDYMTIARIAEDGLHNDDSALFPNIYIVGKKLLDATSSGTSDAAWMAETDARAMAARGTGPATIENVHAAETVIREAICARLTGGLVSAGESNRDCEMLPFIVGALQRHLTEPFGYTTTPVNFSWPHSPSGNETRLTLETLVYVARAYSRARDKSAFNLFLDFMAVRREDNTPLALQLISNIATSVVASIPTIADSAPTQEGGILGEDPNRLR